MNARALLRGTYVRLVAKILVLAFLATSLYNVVTFSQSTQAAVSQSFDDSARVDMYGLTDGLTDPALFEQYLESLVNIEKVTTFYDSLQQDAPAGVRLLSAFDQGMPVADFAGGETFEQGYGTQETVQGPYEDPVLGKQVVNVKSVQLNEAAFDFYNLAGQDDTELDWTAVDYESDTIPVLLGADYEGVYAVGDRLAADYYFKPTQMRVVGFLSPSASMFYQGDINYFLDDHLVVPYPKSITGAAESDPEFYGILAFAMLHANIAVERGQPDSAVFRALQGAATSSGFDQYALLSVPSYLTQFASVRALVHDNFALVLTVECLIAAAALVMSGILTSSATRRRERRIRIAWELGQSRSDLERAALTIVAVEYAGLAAVFLAATHLLPHEDSSTRTLCLTLIALLGAVDLLRRRTQFTHTIRHRPRSEP
ncbi:hypothetical protein [Frigoribacterium sp. PvP032]|uniref:hypothetical protein n=1 Tax=Frigoribacterium sp. PvP032 TaxID=2806589 RepID=UPI001AE4583C|nr:hypothetical protein [Frigoribacterium sp. PvP032]MBP1191850.1 hypothetical protein [Frigoribacterium sp. PvP032]